MVLDYEERKSIKNEILEIADERYVRVEDCNDRQESVNKKFANDDKRIDRLVDRMNLWSKLLWVIASASIGSLVTAIFDLIIK